LSSRKNSRQALRLRKLLDQGVKLPSTSGFAFLVMRASAANPHVPIPIAIEAAPQ
jgi:hypothetical protein